MQDAIVEVLESNWDAEVVARINIHDFSLIWSDTRYKRLATKLRNGPAAEAFHIEILNMLKTYRLEGYWDVLLENAADWLHKVFKKSSPRIPTKDLRRIIMCSGVPNIDYPFILSKLFWDGGEVHKASTRKEEFLAHLPLTEYSEAYNTMMTHPWNPTWNFPEIVQEIREYSSLAKKVMLHVAFWYNPNLTEPHSRERDKKPIHCHLEQYFRALFPQKSHADANKAWSSKAVALQRVVVDFTKANRKDLKGSIMNATLKFNQTPGVYHERFSKGTFWDRLAQETHRTMPEIPFRHPDLLPYNSTGDNIYHSDQRPVLGTPSLAHPEDDVLPIVDLTAEDGDLVALDIEDLIGQEYDSDTPSMEELTDPECYASTSAGHDQTSLASTPTHHLAPGKHDQLHLENDNETADLDTEYVDTKYDGTSPSTPLSTSTRLGKRKASNAGRSYELTPGGRRKHKVIKLKLPDTAVASETATRPSASASDTSQTLRNGRRGVHFFREQVQRQSFSPSRSVPEPSPSTSANDRQQIPIGPIPALRRRRMMTNLPDDMFETPAPSVVESTANRRESARSTSQSPALTAPPAPMFSATQEVTPTRTTETPQAEPPLSSEVKQAVQIMFDEFVDKLNMDEQAAALKEQVDAMKEQVVANKLNMKDQVAVMKEQVNAAKLDVDEQVVTKNKEIDDMNKQVAVINKQIVADKLNMNKQVDAMREQVVADKLSLKDQVAAIKERVDTANLNINEHVAAMKEQVDANEINIKEQVATMKEQVDAIIEQVVADKLNMQEQVDAMKEQVVAMKEQVAAMIPTETSQAEQPQINANRAVDIVVGFLDKLNTRDQVVAFNAVRNERIASLFLKLPAGTREAWLFNEIGVNMDE
ncbi:hypothetical protein V502_06124 [Pseudogymnoascus sp. VKM F-4520 (FW-2644)]|nr:hypothetical protein V502_06124 [Pseudogymnoascus sp. VKM F-4520 (FW-2644)]